jgi:hypothetical protein
MQHETMPSGKLGEALAYLITHWPKLVRYVEDPRLAIDTNLAENAIRPFAFGRRYPRFVIMEDRDCRVAQNRYFSMSASRCTKGRNPTPCTAPVTPKPLPRHKGLYRGRASPHDRLRAPLRNFQLDALYHHVLGVRVTQLFRRHDVQRGALRDRTA